MVGGASAIEAVGLCKSFGDTVVLHNVDLTVTEGTIFGLLGPNGAGKTTTVRILSTLIAPDSGQVRVAGADTVGNAGAVRAAIGVTGQFSAVDDLLTGEENLRLMADLNHLSRTAGRRRVTELLDTFELADAARRRVATYSGGMRRRLDLAMTLISSPRVIFLDEPTAGLDPRGRRTMWEAIRGLAANRVTIFLTTQYLEEADHLADRVAVLDGGRVVAEGTPAQLKRGMSGGHIQLQFTAPDVLHAAERALATTSCDVDNLIMRVPTDGTVAALRRMLDALDEAGVEIAQLSIHNPDLDDVFFAVTSDHGADAADVS